MGCFDCFGGGNKEQRREEERLASEEARARAAEAAQKRFHLLLLFVIVISLFFCFSYRLFSVIWVFREKNGPYLSRCRIRSTEEIRELCIMVIHGLNYK